LHVANATTGHPKERTLEKNRQSIRRKRGHAVTIDEVAKLANVSPMTVSRVVNDHGKVRESTRERVMRAVQELGYAPNLAARALAAASGTRIALIYTNPSAAFLSELLVGALRGAARTAAQLVVDAWDEHDVNVEREAARTLARSVAGVILPPPLCESDAVISELIGAGVVVVALASGGPGDAGGFGEKMSHVRIDDFRASKDMTTHLIEQGHTRIGYIKGHPTHAGSALRLQGFHAALAKAAIPSDESLIEQGYFTYRSGLEAAERLLSHPNPPTAIFASNDDMAAAVISVAHRRGLDVPRDLSVVGFDDTSAATTVWPELTTIRQPVASMADSAIDILLRGIRERDRDTRLVVDHVIGHELVSRDSVARPAKTDARG
jgi:LacI family transcriptional regulator